MDIQRLNALLQMDWSTQQVEAKNQAPEDGSHFGAVLKRAIDALEQQQAEAQQAAVKLATGEINDIAEVMIASERASLSLGLALQVRNKLLDAYQEIMRMPL